MSPLRRIGKIGGALIAGGIMIGLRYLIARRPRTPYPPPESLIIPPKVDAALERNADGSFTIRWERPAAQTRVYVSADPDAAGLDQSAPLTVVEGVGSVTLTIPFTDQRPYVALYFDEDAHPLIVAERTLPLERGYNFRDIGGYRTAEGRHVRWGKLYRTSHFHNLSEADAAYLARLGLRWVCDLRTKREIHEYPDTLPPHAVGVRLPLLADHERGLSPRAILLNLRQLDRLLLRSYTTIILAHKAASFAAMFRALADVSNLPAAVHCTAGKDRTGISIALLLEVLGVPDETIIADYSLTNHAFAGIRVVVDENAGRLRAVGLRPDDLQPLLTADPAIMQETLTFVRERYGSIERYLTETGGLEPEVFERLRANFLR